MEKLIFILGLIVSGAISSFAQGYDDGYVTSNIGVNTSTPTFAGYVNSLNSGIQVVKDGRINSAEGIARYYGVDIRKHNKLSTMVTVTASGNYDGPYSHSFVSTLNAAIENVTQMETVQE